ncbi:hypothetical protein JCM10213_009160 [Rhodosporidiobolus nylandii]
MLAFKTLALLALPALALAGDYGFKKDGGVDVDVRNKAAKKEKELKVSLKEVCYRDLYANVEEFKKKTAKEVKIRDDYGKDVFIFDGFKKDENDVESYYREFCYKDFKFKKHNKEAEKKKVIDIDNKGKFYKRSLGVDGGLGYGGGFDDFIDFGSFDDCDFGFGDGFYKKRA